MSVTLTEKAARHVGEALEARGKGQGIRLHITRSGCSGLGYRIEFVDLPLDDDLVFQSNGISIFIAPRSVEYVSGIVLDYVREGVNEGFVFLNPRAKGSCGCGKSFAP